jgi:hypothetical protein
MPERLVRGNELFARKMSGSRYARDLYIDEAWMEVRRLLAGSVPV